LITAYTLPRGRDWFTESSHFKKENRVLKKIIVVSSAATLAMLCGVGIASAHEAGDGDGSTNCTANDTIHQSNKGHQLVGGNLGAQDVTTNVLGAQASRPAGLCPSVANNNHL
jgi:hypothetical protein